MVAGIFMVSRLWFMGCINNYYFILHGSYVAVWVMGSPTILLLQVTKCQMWHRCYLNKEQHVTKSHNHLSKNNDFPVVTNCTTQRICPKGQHLVEAAKIWQMIAIFFFSIPHPTQLDHYSNSKTVCWGKPEKMMCQIHLRWVWLKRGYGLFWPQESTIHFLISHRVMFEKSATWIFILS